MSELKSCLSVSIVFIEREGVNSLRLCVLESSMTVILESSDVV